MALCIAWEVQDSMSPCRVWPVVGGLREALHSSVYISSLRTQNIEHGLHPARAFDAARFCHRGALYAL